MSVLTMKKVAQLFQKELLRPLLHKFSFLVYRLKRLLTLRFILKENHDGGRISPIHVIIDANYKFTRCLGGSIYV